jgi:4a-hydroxytetrahydrobiopterin dehydratase
MTDIAHERCAACRPGSPRVTEAEIAELLPQIPGWRMADREGVPRLERAYHFSDRARAQAFVRELSALADQEDHHPDIQEGPGAEVVVTWWTHAIRGLHRNDFIMAAKSDLVAQGAEGPA